MKNILLYTSLFIFTIFFTDAFSQNFVKITDPNNPIAADPSPANNYRGCSWIDYNNDGLLDLFVNGHFLFRNLGGGNFTRDTTSIPVTGILSNSWSDYDNDGDIDCFVVSTGATRSGLYRNDGNNQFNMVTAGPIGDSSYNTGWCPSWGDYNNDGYVDLVIAAAYGFNIVFHPSRFYHNNGDGTFARIDTFHFNVTNAPYTVPSWTDFDKDGDIDLFIGSGPGGSTALDYNYRNMRVETGIPDLKRMDTGIVNTSLVDGQNYSFIDYDNDKDVDIFLTNYASSVPNNLYRNEGNGYYVRMTAGEVGTIVSDLGAFLANVWGDFDNDGDVDCFITKESGGSRYYNNNGNGTFTRNDTLQVITLSSVNFGATIGDYDKDGDLDLYQAGPTASKGLFRNDLANGNKWVNIKCEGSGGVSGSNLSAIGTEIRLKANINGNPVWQYREISSLNSFNGMNMLNVHFGLGNASVIDSLVVKWPRGSTQVFTNVVPDNFYKLTEGQSMVSGISQINGTVPVSFRLHQNYPNPFNPATRIKFDITKSSHVRITVYDIAGKLITTLVNSFIGPGSYSVQWDGSKASSGIYFYKIEAGNYIENKKMILLK